MSIQKLDVIVIGAGPAGLAASAAVAEAGLSCVVIDKMGPGGEVMKAFIPIRRSGAVSPSACANPMIVPVRMPGSASGNT